VEEVVSRYPTVHVAVVYLQAKNGQRMGKDWRFEDECGSGGWGRRRSGHRDGGERVTVSKGGREDARCSLEHTRIRY
jgi:hypothetical protein